MDLQKALILFKDFLTPVRKLDQTNLNKVSILTILENINTSFQESHPEFLPTNIQSSTDQLWQFTINSIHLIRTLNTAQFEPSPTNCYLSIENERLLDTLFQLIICFGIHYNLEDNIGIPIEKLSKYGPNITKQRDKVLPSLRNTRLIQVLEFLFELKENKKPHIDIIQAKLYRKYMHELLCGLIQATCSPCNRENIELNSLIKWLDVDLFKESDGSVLVSGLLMAQSSAREVKTVWFLSKIGQMLTKCLLQTNSVMNVVRAVLNEVDAVANVSLASDWKKCDVIARIVAQCPRTVQIEDYVKFLAPQLVDLYLRFDPRYSRHFSRVAGSIYSLFADRWPQLTSIHMTRELLIPFDFSDWPIKTDVVIEWKQWLEKLEVLNLVYIGTTEPSWKTVSQIPVKLIYFIFEIYTQISNQLNISQTKSKCLEILKFYLRMLPNPNNSELSQFLVNLLLSKLVPSADDSTNKNFSRHIQLLNLESIADNVDPDEPSKPLISLLVFPSNDQITIKQVETRSQSIIDLINQIDKDITDQIKIAYMLHIFMALQQSMEIDEQKATKPLTCKLKQSLSNDQTLINLEKSVDSVATLINLKIVYFTQLSKLFESVDVNSLVKKQEKIIAFCHLLLDKVVILMAASEQDNNTELLHLIFSVCSVFTTGMLDMSEEAKSSLKGLLPLLGKFKDFCDEEDLIEMAKGLEQSILKVSGKVATDFELKKSQTRNRVLIEEMENEYEACMTDLKDALVPVRAHGLVSLRRLIEKRDHRVLGDFEGSIELCVKNLKFEDSYVYLAAINALIALADYKPGNVMDILIRQFQSSDKKLDVESRLKIGEVLTKSIRTFNELVPKFGSKLIRAFLVGTRSSDEFLRSSSLSNLGETCKLLNYSLANYLVEIINCLTSIIDTDTSVQCKRSAIMVLKMIVEGLKIHNFIEILGKSALPMYKLVSRTYKTTNDDVIKLHCELTLLALKDLVKISMFPDQKLIKKIMI